MATAVLAPFRLTWLLSPLLRRSGDANIVTLSSGGMYTQPFDLARLEMPPEEYRGTTAYARAKRAQVVLSHEWARRWSGDGVASYAAHPGWVDTPGLASGLPVVCQAGPAAADARRKGPTRWSGWPPARPGVPICRTRWWRGSSMTGTGGASTTCPGRARGAGATDGARLWEWCQSRTGLRGEPPAPSTTTEKE